MVANLLNAINSATQCSFMRPLSAKLTLCRHSIGCRVSVQNLIHAEDVRGRFELDQNPVFHALQELRRNLRFAG
jgi:hypothetical protein